MTICPSRTAPRMPVSSGNTLYSQRYGGNAGPNDSAKVTTPITSTIRIRRSLTPGAITIAITDRISAVTPGNSPSPCQKRRLHVSKWNVPAAAR